MNKKTGLIVVIILLVLSYLAGKYSNPAEVKIKTEYVEKIVYTENKNLVTEIEEVLQACDPTNKTVTIKKTKVTDLSVIKQEKAQGLKTSNETKYAKSKYLLGIGAGYDKTHGNTWTGEANARIGDLPVFGGVQVIGNGLNQAIIGKIMVEF